MNRANNNAGAGSSGGQNNSGDNPSGSFDTQMNQNAMIVPSQETTWNMQLAAAQLAHQ